MPRRNEALIFSRMLRNTPKMVKLAFRHFEVHSKADLQMKDGKEITVVLPSFQLSRLSGVLLREELYYELSKIKGAQEADVLLEIFGVYGGTLNLQDSRRYLGDFLFFASNISTYDSAVLEYKKAHTVYEQRDKTSFIPLKI